MSLADIEVLAETAAQIASGKEDRPRTMLANQGLFFPKMGSEACHPGARSGSAKAGFASQPVDPALPWTEGTLFKKSPGGGSPLVQKTAGMKLASNGYRHGEPGWSLEGACLRKGCCNALPQDKHKSERLSSLEGRRKLWMEQAGCSTISLRIEIGQVKLR